MAKKIQPTREEKEWCKKLEKLMDEQPEGITIASPITIELVRQNNTAKGLEILSRNYYVVVPRSKKILSMI